MTRTPRGYAIGLIVPLGILLFANRTSSGGLVIPDVSVEFTVRQSQNGKIDGGLHLIELSCWNNSCEMSTLSLNQCVNGGTEKRFFYPKIERSSTESGDLHVRDLGGVLDVDETGLDIGGKSTATFRIGYSKRNGIISQVTSVSGGYVKNSDILKKVVTIDYIPLGGDYQYINLDCAVMLPGVPRRQG